MEEMVKQEQVNEQKEMNLDAKVTVKNIAGWSVGFARIADGFGDVTIPADGSTRLSRNEIIAQVQNSNRLLCGVDGAGSHATIYIEDAATRAYLDFDSEDGKRKQNVFSDQKVKSLFDIKKQDEFEAKFKGDIVTRAEKYAVMQAIKRLKINDYSKIRFAEEFTGYRLQ